MLKMRFAIFKQASEVYQIQKRKVGCITQMSEPCKCLTRFFRLAVFHTQLWKRTRALLALMSTNLPKSEMTSKLRHFVDELSPYSEDTVDALSAIANCLGVSNSPSGVSIQSIAGRAVDSRRARVMLDTIDVAKTYLCRQTKAPGKPHVSKFRICRA